MSLKQQAFSGVRWTAFAAVFRAGLQIPQIAILARLLAPEDFGLMAIVAAILSFLTIFADMGISSAIIHHQNITQQQLSSLYWLNVLTGFMMMALLSATSPLIASFYHDSRLTLLIMLASSNFFISALSQQLRVKGEKELKFAILARIELISAVAGFVAVVVMAYKGFGVLSLVGASIISTLLTSLLSWVILANGWYPQFRLRLGEVSEFLNFGAYMVGNNIANNINVMADIFLGGRLLGVTDLGLYSLPRNLCLQVQSLINPIVTRVGFPVMSKVQNDPVQLKTIYLKTMRMTASINFPLYIGMVVFAPEIIAILFGGKWIGSVDILRILAIWGLLRSTMNPVGSLLLAVGKAKLSFKWNVTLVLFVPCVLWWGSHFGVIGMALGLLGLQLASLIPGWYFLVRPCCKASLIEHLKQLVVPLWICLVAVVLGYIVVIDTEFLIFHFSIDFKLSTVIRLVIGLGVSAIVYIRISCFFNREWTSSMLQLLGRKISVS
jgi:O-antigen/teichoic acid export membrane protein